MSGRATHPLARLLEEVIREEGGTLPASDVRDEVVPVIERVTAERTATGEPMAEFCHWMISGGVAVFVFIGDGLDIYVVPCPAKQQYELINRFDRIARTEVDAYRARLHARYGKERPDLVIKPNLAFDWLFLDALPDDYDEPEPAIEPAIQPAAATAAAPMTGAIYDALGHNMVAPVHAATETTDEATETTSAFELAVRASGTDDAEPEPDEPDPRLDALSPPIPDAPTLEDLMAAVRAQGGGKGSRPLRPTDLG